MKVFDDLAGKEAITAEDAFTLVATYGFPIELAQELGEERGPGDRHGRLPRADGAASGDLARRRRERPPSRRPRSSSSPAARPSEFVGYAKTTVLTAVIESGPVDGSRAVREARAEPVLCRGRRPGRRHRLPPGGRRRASASRWRDVLKFGDDQVLVVALDGHPPLDARHARRRRRQLGRPLPDDGESHGHASAARRAARGARRPRQAGRLGGTARQAALRLLARRAPHARAARAGRADRQRQGLRGDPGAHVRDADRRGPHAWAR